MPQFPNYLFLLLASRRLQIFNVYNDLTLPELIIEFTRFGDDVKPVSMAMAHTSRI
jgi:hypothetical protein